MKLLRLWDARAMVAGNMKRLTDKVLLQITALSNPVWSPESRHFSKKVSTLFIGS